ncbi:hypothetical protein [Halorhabdus sp. BNX81]|uniref:hypothetical protein n=1 Tax=Halorhabdus sp. BNX81 TaxID=2980181 RepID=UPI0023DD2BA0|nr:hypothetical protein [Halorhabdus sp. BNX81]
MQPVTDRGRDAGTIPETGPPWRRFRHPVREAPFGRPLNGPGVRAIGRELFTPDLLDGCR